MAGLLLGVSGLPVASGKKFNFATGIGYLKSIGLGALELQFGRRVNVTAKNRDAILKSKLDNDFTLSAHASYFINLGAEALETREASVARILAAAAAISQVQGKKVVFHAGYYGGKDRTETYGSIRDILAGLPDQGIDYRVETTGKGTQFGTVEELVALCRDVPTCLLCLDFAHIHARGQGSLKTYDDFVRILDHIGEHLGRAALDDMHIHVSGVAYGRAGEIRHLPFEESDFNLAACVKALKDYAVQGCVISESPMVESDGLLLKKMYEEL